MQVDLATPAASTPKRKRKRAVPPRRALDFYPTPAWQTEALLSRLTLSGIVLEPCCGDGAIANVLRAQSHAVITNDLDRKWPADHHLDVTKAESWAALPPFDWLVTNLPFKAAADILPLALQNARVGVATILRISYPEPTIKRREWLAANPPDAIGYLPRVSYDGTGGSDSATTAWFVWFADAAAREAYARGRGWRTNWVHSQKAG